MRKISALLFGWLLLLNGSAFGQSAQTVAAAKKEGGKVIVYTSMETFTADAIKAAFEENRLADGILARRFDRSSRPRA